MGTYASYAWLITGVLVFILEGLAMTMTFFFFGISAILVSILLFAGFDIGPLYQFLVFGVTSVCLLFLYHKHTGPLSMGSAPDSKQSESLEMTRDLED